MRNASHSFSEALHLCYQHVSGCWSSHPPLPLSPRTPSNQFNGGDEEGPMLLCLRQCNNTASESANEGWAGVAQWYTTRLACVRPWVLCPVLKIKTNHRERREHKKSDSLDFSRMSLVSLLGIGANPGSDSCRCLRLTWDHVYN